MKIGLEIEYWVIDQKGRLTSSKKLAENHGSAEQEFVQPLIEIKTQPHTNIEELKQDITKKLHSLVQEAEKLNQKIVSLGTPLNSQNIELVPSKRGQIQRKIIGENLEAAKRVAGTHIHFEKQQTKKQLNALTALDPAHALTNSSPHYQGKKTASSSRNQVYRHKCYKNHPKHGQLWNYTDSVKEWENRIQKNFQKFLKAAKNQGINQKQVNKHFKPSNALWTPVRLRKDFPTIEWRAPDTTKTKNILKLTKKMKQHLEKPEKVEKPSFNKLQKLTQKATKQGLQENKVKKYLEKQEFNTRQYQPISPEIKQEKLDINQARKIRLKYAQKHHKNAKKSI